MKILILMNFYQEKINNTNPIVFDVGGNKGQSVEKFKKF